MAGPTQNPLGARHQAAARWRNEEGQGVGRCEMLWVGYVGDWGGEGEVRLGKGGVPGHCGNGWGVGFASSAWEILGVERV